MYDEPDDTAKPGAACDGVYEELDAPCKSVGVYEEPDGTKGVELECVATGELEVI
jgi:hypothetical protein